MKSSIKCLMLVLFFHNYLFADSSSNVQIDKLVINPKVDNSVFYNKKIQNDGAVWGITNVLKNMSTVDLSINKLSKNNSVVAMGIIPHPELKVLTTTQNNILMATNSSGTALVSYIFYNEKNKYQRVFYLLKNKSWTRLADFTDDTVVLNINQVFLDNNDNAYFSTTSTYRYYSLTNGSWVLMDNPANDSKTDISSEKVFSIANNSVFSTRVSNNQGNGSTFQIYKYNSNSVDYSDSIPLGDGEFSPACTTMVDDNTAIVEYLNNHANLTKQLIRFDAVKLNNNTVYPYPAKSNNSLFGSIVAIGQSISNIATGGNNSSSSKSKGDNSTTLGELDLNQFTYGYDVANVAQRLTCTTIGNTSYFIVETYGKYPDPQYVYFKVKNITQ